MFFLVCVVCVPNFDFDYYTADFRDSISGFLWKRPCTVSYDAFWLKIILSIDVPNFNRIRRWVAGSLTVILVGCPCMLNWGWKATFGSQNNPILRVVERSKPSNLDYSIKLQLLIRRLFETLRTMLLVSVYHFTENVVFFGTVKLTEETFFCVSTMAISNSWTKFSGW